MARHSGRSIFLDVSERCCRRNTDTNAGSRKRGKCRASERLCFGARPRIGHLPRYTYGLAVMVCLPAFFVSGGLIWLHALMRYLAKSCFPWSVFLGYLLPTCPFQVSSSAHVD